MYTYTSLNMGGFLKVAWLKARDAWGQQRHHEGPYSIGLILRRARKYCYSSTYAEFRTGLGFRVRAPPQTLNPQALATLGCETLPSIMTLAKSRIAS